MRQPKFRGFSIETNSWHYGHGWFEVDYTDEYLEEKGIQQQSMLYTEGYPVECELVSMGEITGLLDSKGREIYEGDILKIPDLYETPENTTTTYHNAAIEFSYGSFTLDGIPLFEDAEYISGECEVIGNVYEMPDWDF